jgi:hypothetical protein
MGNLVELAVNMKGASAFRMQEPRATALDARVVLVPEGLGLPVTLPIAWCVVEKDEKTGEEQYLVGGLAASLAEGQGKAVVALEAEKARSAR